MYSSQSIINAISNIKTNRTIVSEIVDRVLIEDKKITVFLKSKNASKDDMIWLESECKKAIYAIIQSNNIEIRIIFVEEISQKSVTQKNSITGVKKIFLVASGKGGVGKSTVASSLALSLAKDGMRVGLLDADIYGPSIPHLFQINAKPELSKDDKIIPIMVNGIRIMSMGFLVAQEKALIWRGPMLAKALFQLTHGVDWRGLDSQDLDILLIDTPPGTGDIHLSLGTKYNIDGVIFVTTPQSLAINDTIKSIAMFKELEIPIIGLIENMGYFLSASGEKHYIFGKGLINEYCVKNNISYWGSIPIKAEISDDKALSRNIKIIYELFNGVSDNFKAYI